MLEPLVESTRGVDGVETAECIHVGAVAVVDVTGRLVAQAGDPDFQTFTRSTIKPFQALPLVEGGGAARLGWGSEELALTCASHSGGPSHLDVVRRMLRSAGQDAARLQCGCHVPLRFAATGTVPAAGERFDAVTNNCSGKHAGFLAWCAQHDAPHETYLEQAHPLQRAVRHAVSQACEVAPDAMAVGIDGCSAPNYAMPLQRLALGYARLARGDGALGPLRDAMTAHPALVSGQGRNDLALMQAAPGDWVAKVGADGVQAIGVRSAGLGIAVKAAGGDNRAACIAAIAVLRALGLLRAVQDTPLAAFAAPEIRNARGTVTGRLRPVFTLR